MPLNNERPTSTSSGEDLSGDVESLSESCDNMTLASDRDSFNSDCSSKHSSPSSSPPKVLTLDEVMASGKDLFDLRLAHEITVNPSFRMEANVRSQNSLWNAVEDNLHRAYWDILQTELNDDPPEYRHAIKLLEEIREILLSFLNPGTNRMRTQIMEVLDMDLIRQQADNNAVDIPGLASYIISTMDKLCAPVRSRDVAKLRESTDNIVTLLKEIFRVLNLMRVDLVNFSIDSLRVMLQRSGVEYERATFQKILDSTPTALKHTTSWIQSALDELLAAAGGQGKGQQPMVGAFQLLNTAFLHLLTCDFSKDPLPETWVLDESRLQETRFLLQRVQTVNGVLLIVFQTVGGPVQDLPSLSDRLKRMISVLLEGMHRPDFNLGESLEAVSAQTCRELNKSLTERNFPALTPELQDTLTGQICSINQEDNPIRTLIGN
ncbi:T-complex protein 11-like protein 2 [Cololabis saira]|uniref:T-complex protein 11-like protein 2 n=1 Tax=Cololabis saira TaxID=129043 RepID=UPI002AD32B9F|nr:T-complex protein 11-like protein 2 [Cololabis saira]